MDNDLVSYIERLELLAFFSGYPLIYTIVYFIAGEKGKKPVTFLNGLVKLLPFAYALAGTLFVGYILKNMYPDYTFKNIALQFQTSYLKIWGLLAVLFWIPVFNKKTIFSLLHSLVFFFFLLKDFFLYLTSSLGKEMIQNDMKIYTNSLLLNMVALVIIVIINCILIFVRQYKKPSGN
jgi:hypothetical protein